MGSASVFLIILVIGVVALFSDAFQVGGVVNGDVRKLHSRPSYFGASAIWAILPAALFLSSRRMSARTIVERSVRASLPAEHLAKPPERAGHHLRHGQVDRDRFRTACRPKSARRLTGISPSSSRCSARRACRWRQDPQPFMVDAAKHLVSETDARRSWDHCRRFDPDRAGRFLFLVFACLADFPRTQQCRALHALGADPVIHDRDPHDFRHHRLADLRDLPLLRPGFSDELLLRHGVGSSLLHQRQHVGPVRPDSAAARHACISRWSPC